MLGQGLYTQYYIRGIGDTVLECHEVRRASARARPAHTATSMQRCACDVGCPNRVAQRPRAVPIEVYKTRAKGWAVRAAQDLPVGKVLGVFTGCVPALAPYV
jgi:hypothetical protein